MNCRSFINDVEEANAGERLGEDASRHLRACNACRKFYEEQAALRRLMRELEVVPAPSNFDFRLRARLAADDAAGRGFLRGAFAPGFVSIALAACFALTVGLALVFKHSPRGETAALPASTPREAGRNQTLIEPRKLNVAAREAEAESSIATTESQLGSLGTMRNVPRMRPRVASTRPADISRNDVRETASNSFGVEGARLYASVAADSTATDGGVITVPMNAGTLEVRAQDEEGRKISLQPVSFGAQGLVNPDSRRKPASASERAW